MKRVKHIQMYQDLLKSCQHEKSRLLGVDVGDKFVGLSVSDAKNKVASPLSVLVRTKSNIDLMATDFQTLISKFSLAGLVIGYPYDRIQYNDNAFTVINFIDELSNTGKLDGVKYALWDEAFTSKSIDCLLRPLKLHPVQAKTMLDKFAAVSILQGYLDYFNRNQGKKPQRLKVIDHQILCKESTQNLHEFTLNM